MEAPFAKKPLATSRHNTEKPILISIPGLMYQEIPGDGHCLYHAVAIHVGQEQSYLRRIVAAHLEANIGTFREFIDLPAGQTIESYLESIRAGNEWAANIEIEVLMQVLDRPIIVLDSAGIIRNQEDITRFNGEPIFVCYNGHNHYDAFLRESNVPAQTILNNLIAKNTVSKEQHSLPSPHLYEFAPKIKEVGLEIIMEPGASLPERFPELIERITRDKSLLGGAGDAIFEKVIRDSPSAAIARPIKSEPTFEKKAVKINIAGPRAPQIWNVPPQNLNYVERFRDEVNLVEQIKNLFVVKKAYLALTALHGLGGIGKTQLALAYVWKYQQDYQGVYWFRSDTRENLIIQYISFGQELRLYRKNDIELVSEEKAKKVKTWFENSNDKNWLIILDNPEKYDRVKDLLPTHGGHILITSRHTEWPGIRLPLGIFDENEAFAFAEKILGIEKAKAELGKLKNLFKLLGLLPLALAQAFAYIRRNCKAISEYLDLYESCRTELLSESLLPSEDHYQAAVAITWNITLKKMREESIGSEQLLHYSAYIHHMAIPLNILRYFFPDKNKFFRDAAIRIAREYSMIEVDHKEEVFSIHNLVQEIIRMQLEKSNKINTNLIACFHAVDNLYPYRKENNIDYKVKRKMIIHLQVFTENINRYALKIQDAHIVRLRALIFLSEAHENFENIPEMINVLEQVLSLNKAFNGEGNLEVAKASEKLGFAYLKYGNYNQGCELIRNANEIKLKGYSNDEKAIAISWQYLAEMHIIQNELEKGKEYLEKSLRVFEKHSKDSIEVGIILNSLSVIEYKLGNYKRQKELLMRALPIYQKKFKADHYEYAKIQVNLAIAYLGLRNPEKARSILLMFIPILEEHYGKDSINMEIPWINLARAYNELGNTQEAKLLFNRILPIQKEYYGEKDSKVAMTLYNLGLCSIAQHDTSPGLKFMQESAVSVDQFSHQAETSGFNYKSWFDLAYSYCANNDLLKAIHSYILITISFRHCQEAHQELGCLYHIYKDYAESKKHFERAIEIEAFTSTYCYYGFSLLQQKKYESAIYMFSAVMVKNDDNSYLRFYELKNNLIDEYLKDEVTRMTSFIAKPFVLACYGLIQCYNILNDRELTDFHLTILESHCHEHKNAFYYRVLGYSYKHLNKQDDAEACFAIALSLESQFLMLNSPSSNGLQNDYISKFKKITESKPSKLRYCSLSHMYEVIGDEDQEQVTQALALSLNATTHDKLDRPIDDKRNTSKMQFTINNNYTPRIFGATRNSSSLRIELLPTEKVELEYLLKNAKISFIYDLEIRMVKMVFDNVSLKNQFIRLLCKLGISKTDKPIELENSIKLTAERYDELLLIISNNENQKNNSTSSATL